MTAETDARITAAHARYLTLAAERDALADQVTDEDAEHGVVSDELHDARDAIDRDVLDAAEDLLSALGYAP